MTNTLPKLRSDLTFSPQQTASGPIIIVKDRGTGQFFRFGEAEQFIAQQLDGATSMDVVREKVEGKFGASLAPETLERFVRSLEKSGLLESEKGERKRTRRRERRLRGSILYLRYKLFDPDRLFDRVIGQIGFFFTPHFFVISACSILFAFAVVLCNLDAIGENLSRLYSVSAIPLISLMIFLVITGHEFAHGLTCKRFGGEVHEVGFLLMYFQPAFYCNVSDAWLFPEKSKRLWVGFAGPYFELFLWSIAVLIWRVTEVDTWLNLLAFIVVTTSGIKTLLNFNPLLKLDGYYLLSDCLEIPNLRRRAFRYIGSGLKRIVGATVDPPESLTRRERRVFLAYGLVGTLGSFSVLGIGLATIGTFLVEQNQPMALALFSGLLGAKFRKRLRRLFGKSGGSDDDDDEEDAVSQEETEPAEKTKQKKKRSRAIWKGPIKTLVAAGLAAAVLFIGRMELRIAGPFAVVPIRNADVRAEVEGIIEEILVDEGNLVKEGDLIAKISDRDYRAELQKIEAELGQTRAKLNMLKAGPRAEEIELAKSAVVKAEDRLKFAKSRLERDQTLFEQKLLSKNDYETTAELAASTENDLGEAKNRLKVLLAGSRPEEIEATEAEIARLEAQRRLLADQLADVRVLSPTTGIVATPSRMLREMKYQLVKKGDLIAKVYDLKTLTVEIVISEKDIADVTVGQKVLLKARAYPDETFQGTITSIATAVQSSSSSSSSSSSANPGSSGGASFSRTTVTPKTILVTTTIDNRSLLLKPEMTGQAKIFCGERRIFDLVTRRIARTVKVEFWSWW